MPRRNQHPILDNQIENEKKFPPGSRIRVCKTKDVWNDCSPDQTLSVNYIGDVDAQWFTAEAQTYIFEFDFKGTVIFVRQRAGYDSSLSLVEVYFEGKFTTTSSHTFTD